MKVLKDFTHTLVIFFGLLSLIALGTFLGNLLLPPKVEVSLKQLKTLTGTVICPPHEKTCYQWIPTGKRK